MLVNPNFDETKCVSANSNSKFIVSLKKTTNIGITSKYYLAKKSEEMEKNPVQI